MNDDTSLSSPGHAMAGSARDDQATMDAAVGTDPAVAVPEVESPVIDLPETDVPETDLPETGLPEVDLPEAETPEAGQPEAPSLPAQLAEAAPRPPVAQPAFAGVAFASLNGRAVIVTGGASGIGADIVRAFAAQGASVGFLDRDEAAGQALAAGLPNAHFQACDLTSVPALQAAMAMLIARLGAVDVLVNNVANDDRHRVEDVTPDYFDDRVAVNLRPHFFASQAVIGPMRERGGGAIVNLGSTSWKIKETGLLIYATCKSAMSGFTRSLARELGPDNIRVNCVLPGWVMTERQLALWVDEEGEREMDRSQCLAGRIVGADIAHMVLFLAADTARMITAQEFIVDGGWC